MIFESNWCIWRVFESNIEPVDDVWRLNKDFLDVPAASGFWKKSSRPFGHGIFVCVEPPFLVGISFVNGGDCKGNITPKCPLRYLYIGFGNNSNLPRTRWMVRCFFSQRPTPPQTWWNDPGPELRIFFGWGGEKHLTVFGPWYHDRLRKNIRVRLFSGFFRGWWWGYGFHKMGRKIECGRWREDVSGKQAVWGNNLSANGIFDLFITSYQFWSIGICFKVWTEIITSLSFSCDPETKKWKQVGRCLHVSEAPWLLHLGCTCLGAWRSKSSKSLGGSCKKVPSRHGRQM